MSNSSRPPRPPRRPSTGIGGAMVASNPSSATDYWSLGQNEITILNKSIGEHRAREDVASRRLYESDVERIFFSGCLTGFVLGSISAVAYALFVGKKK